MIPVKDDADTSKFVSEESMPNVVGSVPESEVE